MKAVHVVRCVGSALIVLTTLSAYAQGGSAPAVAPAVAQSSSVKAMRAANRQLQKQVRKALTRTKGLNGSGISVQARSGVVTLQGWVPEQSQAALATQAAEGVPGVTSVKSELTVRPVGQ
jgi:hyperosmotically inducible protein